MNTDKRLIRQAKQLARKECCNYFDGDCIYTDRPCHIINPIYPSIHSGDIISAKEKKGVIVTV